MIGRVLNLPLLSIQHPVHNILRILKLNFASLIFVLISELTCDRCLALHVCFFLLLQLTEKSHEIQLLTEDLHQHKQGLQKLKSFNSDVLQQVRLLLVNNMFFFSHSGIIGTKSESSGLFMSWYYCDITAFERNITAAN